MFCFGQTLKILFSYFSLFNKIYLPGKKNLWTGLLWIPFLAGRFEAKFWPMLISQFIWAITFNKRNYQELKWSVTITSWSFQNFHYFDTTKMNKDALFFWPHYWRLVLLVYSSECKWKGLIKGQLRYWVQLPPYWKQLLLLPKVLCTWRCSCHKRGRQLSCGRSMWKRLFSFDLWKEVSESSGRYMCRRE